MPSIYDHELSAYRREIDQYQDGVSAAFEAGANSTHIALGLSNRAKGVSGSLNFGAVDDRAVRECVDLHCLVGKPVEELPT